ncbi:hypothetical protein VNO77_21782 [Canavalia gladiata]|uniref:Uncharacterized protein n=1 Tax=Canavalia gladiata TaxID=3824 RepID=A0AAN9QAG1_CANGL
MKRWYGEVKRVSSVPLKRDICILLLRLQSASIFSLSRENKKKEIINLIWGQSDEGISAFRMEPPHVMLGGAEECHSSESGWTMYIGSPIAHEDAHCDYDDDDNLDYDYGDTHADPEAESDDSMASDASSGPSHYGMSNPLGNDYDGFTQFQQKGKEEYGNNKEKYCSSHKRATSTKTKGNQVVEKRVEKNEMVFIHGKAKAKVPAIAKGGKAKVRENHRMGNRK